MSPRKPPDFWLFTLTVALLVIGVFMVFDASYARAGQEKMTGGDSLYFMKRQVLFALPGLAMMFLAMQIRYWKFRHFGRILLLLAITGLALVLVPGIGETVNGATRWIRIGSIQVQPSEFAKVCLVIYLAAALSAKKQEVRDWKHGLLPLAIPVGLVAILTVKEDLGTAVVLVTTALVMVYMAGAKKRHFAVALGMCGLLGAIAIIIEPYRLNRIIAFIDPFKDYYGSGYQVCQSLIALGSGGVFGVGLCEGKEKLFYLPAEHTDFILAVLGEEAGLIGTSLIVVLFLLLAARGFHIAYHTKEPFGRLLAAGLTALICGQALLNVCVVTSSLPATGVPLPFISYGGSSLVMNLICVGILLGVSRHPGPIKDYQ